MKTNIFISVLTLAAVLNSAVTHADETTATGDATATEEVISAEGKSLVTEGKDADEEMGKLAAFAGVAEFPVRVKCATLAWHTLHAALNNETQPVSTES